MTDLKILLWPDPKLKMESSYVKRPDTWRSAVEPMIELMERSGGVGLSAIQIGIPCRLVVSKFAPPMYNPTIIGYNIERHPVREGCLSLPGFYETVLRHPSIQLAYQDLDLNHHEASFTGLAAQCFQHELEHLDGHFFTDHLPAGERSRIRGEVMKLKRAGKWR